jgi:hypothetical protein
MTKPPDSHATEPMIGHWPAIFRRDEKMNDDFVQPVGRRTIRNRHVGIWDIPTQPGTTRHRLREEAYKVGLGNFDAMEGRVKAARTSGKFTEDGVITDARGFAAQNLAPPLHRANQLIARAEKEVAERTAKLVLQIPPDSTGFREQFRRYLLSMPPAEREAYVSKEIDNFNQEKTLAIVEVQQNFPELAGVGKMHSRLLFDRVMEAQHGQELTELNYDRRAIELSSRSVNIGHQEIARDAGFLDPRELDRIAEPYVKAAAAPWLKKFKENGEEVVRIAKWNVPTGLGAGLGNSWVKATPEEIEAGAFYDTFEEFDKARGGSVAA